MGEIKGTTKLVGLIGWPVNHSLSPQMHNAAFADKGLDFCYVAFPVKPAALKQAILGLRALGMIGANVAVGVSVGKDVGVGEGRGVTVGPLGGLAYVATMLNSAVSTQRLASSTSSPAVR